MTMLFLSFHPSWQLMSYISLLALAKHLIATVTELNKSDKRLR